MLDPFPGASRTCCSPCRPGGFQGALFRQRDLSRVAPQPFEGVVFANILLKNVNDDVTKIHYDPFGRRGAFNAERGLSLRGEAVANMVGNRPSLALRFPGSDDQIVGDRSQCGDMQDQDIGGLLVQDGACTRESLILCFKYDRGPPCITPREVYRIRQGGATDLPEDCPSADVS